MSSRSKLNSFLQFNVLS